MNQTRLTARFPSVSFISQAEFNEYCRVTQAALDTRYLHETSLTVRDEPLVQAGTCAPCLRRTVYTTDIPAWDRLPDGRRVPDWEPAQTCDCADRLPGQARAVLHFAQSNANLSAATRLLLLGPEPVAGARLAAGAGETTRIARLVDEPGGYRLQAADGAFHLAVSCGYLHRVPPLAAALAELRRVLAPGGALVFTVPFRYRAAHTVTRTNLPGVSDRLPGEYREAVHEIGWDVLGLLRTAGFRQAAVHSYWSAELGYLGPFNMLLHAVA